MKILSREEATHVERPNSPHPWQWPAAVSVCVSNSWGVLPYIGARTPDGDPLAEGVAVRYLETLYEHGYVLAKLDDSDKPEAVVSA